MAPTSISGEWQVGIGGSSIFHLIYAMRGCAEIHIGKLSAKADSESRTKTRKRVLNLPKVKNHKLVVINSTPNIYNYARVLLNFML